MKSFCFQTNITEIAKIFFERTVATKCGSELNNEPESPFRSRGEIERRIIRSV